MKMKKEIIRLILAYLVVIVGVFLCGACPVSKNTVDSNPVVSSADSLKNDIEKSNDIKDLDKVDSLWLIQICSSK